MATTPSLAPASSPVRASAADGPLAKDALAKAQTVVDTYQSVAPPTQRSRIGAPAGEEMGELAACLTSTTCLPVVSTSSTAALCSEDARHFVDDFMR